jgi:hypothetical protein
LRAIVHNRPLPLPYSLSNVVVVVVVVDDDDDDDDDTN